MKEQDKKLQVPSHIAFIMDGNRRWATERGKPTFFGHSEGRKTVRKIIAEGAKRKIPYLTFYALSTENLKRSEEELKHLFKLLGQLPRYIKEFDENNVKVRIIGKREGLPIKTQKNLNRIEQETEKNTGTVVQFAINYGGRDEIVRAVQKIIESGEKNVSEKIFEGYLDTAGIPDVDLVIRTGGEQRLSNYLPWQTTYAELYFTSVKWPDFSANYLEEALHWFLQQKRNKGK